MAAINPKIVERLATAARAVIEKEGNRIFHCGGTYQPSSVPFSIWYDGGRLDFPLDSSAASFQKILDSGEPAAYGKGRKRVLDESYRKAIAVDSFALKWHPSDAGLLNVIEEIMTPNKRLRAELYKLNVYGPGDFFKAHVDTPRGPDACGTLVICLPVIHTGGGLRIFSGDVEVVYDWGKNISEGTSALQWAAFFGDCGHEVLKVESGHRVTITYNLYFQQVGKPSAGVVVPKSGTVDHALLNDLRECASSIQGAMLGFHLLYQYPAADRREKIELANLKGVDTIIANTFEAAGFKPLVCPVFDYEFYTEHGDSSRTGITLSTEVPHIDDFSECDDVVADSTTLAEELGVALVDRIHWLNEKEESNTLVADKYAAFGNEPSINTLYYNVAIIVGYDRKSQKKIPKHEPNTFMSDEV